MAQSCAQSRCARQGSPDESKLWTTLTNLTVLSTAARSDSSRPDVLLTNTSWWACASMVALALHKSGCAVSALYPRSGHPLAKTSVIEQRHAYSPFATLASLRSAIEAVNPELIVPCDDRAVSHLHRLHAKALLQKTTSGRRLAGLIEKSLGDAAAFNTALSRCEFLNLAGESGIRIPETKALETPEDLHRWAAKQPFPWVIKIDGSWGGHGVKIVHSFAEAQSAVLALRRRSGWLKVLKRWLCNRDAFWIENALQKDQPSLSVQTYIPGRPANRAVFCADGRVLGGVTVEALVAQGETGAANVVRVMENDAITDAVRMMAKRLRLSGFHGFDFVLTDNHQPYLLELNPRCTPPCHIPVRQGGDLSAALFSYLRPGCPPRLRPTITSDTIVYFPQAWQSDPHSAYLVSAYHAVPWEEPALLRDLLRLPYADRSVLARLSDRLRNHTPSERAARIANFHSEDEASASSRIIRSNTFL